MITKTKIIRVLSGLATILSIIIIVDIVHFIDANNFKFQTPFIAQQFVVATPKAEVVYNIIQNETQAQNLDSNESYICSVFGTECRQALEVQHLEDGNEQCDRLHINTGKNSFDVGLLQVDSEHIGQTIDGHTITLAELTTCKGNVDDAYLIYKHSGWSAWSSWILIPNNLK